MGKIPVFYLDHYTIFHPKNQDDSQKFSVSTTKKSANFVSKVCRSNPFFIQLPEQPDMQHSFRRRPGCLHSTNRVPLYLGADIP
jgi:hypothetical protein